MAKTGIVCCGWIDFNIFLMFCVKRIFNFSTGIVREGMWEHHVNRF